jgi:hypothetical protein
MAKWKMSIVGPDLLLPFDHGTLRLIFTNSEHVKVTAQGLPLMGEVTFRDESWYVSLDLWAASDWGEDRAADGRGIGRTSHNDIPHAMGSRKSLAPTYRAELVKKVTKAVAAFVEANPEVLVAADRNNWQRLAEILRGEIEDLEEQKVAKVARLHGLMEKLGQLPAV